MNILCPGCESHDEKSAFSANFVTVFPSGMSAPVIQQIGGSFNKTGGNIPVDKGFCPAGRMGDEKDMAGQILYLASRAGAYCNGNTIVCDGGRLSTLPSSGF